MKRNSARFGLALFAALVVTPVTLFAKFDQGEINVSFGDKELTPTGKAAVGKAADQWNALGNEGDRVELRDADGKRTEVRISFESDRSFDARDNSPFAGGPFEKLMRKFLVGLEDRKVTVTGLTSGAAYDLYLFAGADRGAGGRKTKMTAPGESKVLTFDPGQKELAAGNTYAKFTVRADKSGSIALTYGPSDGGEGNLNGLQLVAGAAAPAQDEAELAGVLIKVDLKGGEITIRGEGTATERVMVGKGTEITVDSKPAQLADLKEKSQVVVTYERKQRTALSVAARTLKSATETARVDSPKPATPKAEPRKPAPSQGLAASKSMGGTIVAPEGDWPQFRGIHRDGLSTETRLLPEWPENGPRQVWHAKGLGEGFSSLAVTQGLVITMGNRDRDERVIALRESDGTEAWSSVVGTVRSNGSGYPGPRCIPTVDGDLLYALGINGDLVCLETRTGQERWRADFPKDFEGRMMSGWGYSESPLVDGDRVICTPGGDKHTLVALDKRTGKTIWSSAVPRAGGAGYASPVVAEVDGVKMYITLVGHGVVGVAAQDGRFLWLYERVANNTANIPTPVVVGSRVFCSTGYGAGAALLRLSKTADGIEAREEYFLNADQFQNHHGGFVVIDGYVYGGNGHNNGFPACLELETGKSLWGKHRGAGRESAAVTYADGKLYFRYQDGVMALVEATPSEYRLISSFKLPTSGKPSWPYPVISHGRLWIRDQDDLYCHDLRSP